MACENEAVPTCEPSVEVAMVVSRVGEVPYAKPDSVASCPPVDTIDPFSVAEFVETLVGVRVLVMGGQGEVANV